MKWNKYFSFGWLHNWIHLPADTNFQLKFLQFYEFAEIEIDLISGECTTKHSEHNDLILWITYLVWIADGLLPQTRMRDVTLNRKKNISSTVAIAIRILSKHRLRFWSNLFSGYSNSQFQQRLGGLGSLMSCVINARSTVSNCGAIKLPSWANRKVTNLRKPLIVLITNQANQSLLRW